MLVIVLAFAMMVVGCEDDSERERPPAYFFDWDIDIINIPSSLNDENFTMSIIRDDIVKTSKTGVVVDGEASANLVTRKMADKSEITLDYSGNEIWTAYIAIKIGSNQQLIMEKDFHKLPDDTKTYALVNGSEYYSYFYFQ
jgi:hypothetical protein